jgi:small conductance mechanosensitive channel
MFEAGRPRGRSWRDFVLDRRLIRPFITIVAFLLAAGAFGQAWAAAEAPDEAGAERANIETLRARYHGQIRQVEALEADAETASGSDLEALRAETIDLRIAATGTAREWIEAVTAAESTGGAAAADRREVAELIPRLNAGIERHYGLAKEKLAARMAALDEAAPEARPEAYQNARRADELVGRLLGVAVDQVELLQELEMAADPLLSWLAPELEVRARLGSARMNLLAARLVESEARSAATPDDTALLAELVAASSRLKSETDSLRATVGLMDRLSLDVSPYQQLLIESTGELTTDVLDRRVAGELLGRWASGVQETVASDGPQILFKTFVFLLVLGVFWILARFVRRVTQKAVEAPHLQLSELLKRMIVSGASGIVIVLGILLALSQVGFQMGPMLAGLGIAGFVIGFALQDSLANFAAGVMILLYRPFDTGDLIECAGGVFGQVSHMNLVSTTILTLDNQTRIVPNGKIWGDVITNVTAQDVRRVDLVFGISYSDDIPHAEQVLSSVLKEHPKVLDEPKAVVKVHELGDSSVNFVVRPWAAREDYWQVYWDVTREVKLCFDREGISIPFPQRDVHFYAANGGQAVAASDAGITGSSGA